MSKIAVGMDLGTSNSKIGAFKDGKAQLIPNSIGDTSTPSIVEILESGEIIGEQTIIHKADEKHTINQIKRLLGKKLSDLKDLKDINYDLVGDKDNKLQIKVNINGKDILYSPEQIMALIIKKLIKDASDFMETPITKAVITVPAYFDFSQRAALEQSAKLAGINDIGLINEPTAAALAYGLGTKENLSESISLTIIKKEKKKMRKVLVFDLGGGTFDVSIFTIEDTKFTTISTSGDAHLGGIYFDNKLINYCIKDFCQKMEVDENNLRKDLNALKRLRIQCEKAKKFLSKYNKTTIKINNFYSGHNLYIEIEREEFNRECEEFYDKIEKILDKTLLESKFTNDEIDDVIIVGGSSKMPKIREIIEKKFNPLKIRDKINQDEVVTIGATWNAHQLAKNNKDFNILDITPSTLGVGSISKIVEERINGQIMSILIPKNSEIPAKSNKNYRTFEDNQKKFRIKVYSGENYFVKDNKLLGILEINGLPPGPAKSVTLKIGFEVDKNGLLRVNAEANGIILHKNFSIFENQNTESTTIIALKTNPKSKQKLDDIKNITNLIKEKNQLLKNTQNDNDKIKILNELCDYCSKIINIYNDLRKNNDSENLYEKYFDYSIALFKYYSKIIIISKDEKTITDILNKIKEEIPNFINEEIQNIIESFDELKDENPKIYVEIILYIEEILYKEGDKILAEGKAYARYYSKKFYIKAEKIKTFIDNNLKAKIDFKLKQRIEEIEAKYKAKIVEIDSFTSIIKNQIEKRNTEFIPRRSGNSVINNILKKAEDLYLIIDIFQDMENSLSKGPPTETEAYCILNIMKINFKYFNNYDFELYDRRKRRIDKILEKLEEEENNDEEKTPEWYEQYEELCKEIEEKKEELEKIPPETLKKIEEINNVYNEKIKNNKPKEFIEFIFTNYPYNKFDISTKNILLQKNLKDLLADISPNYHPDNYGKDKFPIYHEISTLLANLGNQYKGNQ